VQLEIERQRSAAASAEFQRAHEAGLVAQRAYEQEAEFTALERRLSELSEERKRLMREKAQLENDLEAEQEYISLKLTKQVEKLAAEKAALAREKAELQRHVNDLSASVARTRKEKVALEAALEAEEEAAVNRLQRQLQQVTTAYRALESRLEAHGLSSRAEGVPAIDATLDWIYGRSPSRNSMDRFGGGGSHARRERSVSVSSTSSMRDASHSVMSTHVSGDVVHSGGHAHAAIGTTNAAMNMVGGGNSPHLSPMARDIHNPQHAHHQQPFGGAMMASGMYMSSDAGEHRRRSSLSGGAAATGGGGGLPQGQTAAGSLMMHSQPRR
jgi:hypothetical protein